MDDSITIIGTIQRIGETQTFASGFSKRIVRIETDGEYPQVHDVEAVKERCEDLNLFKVGQRVKLSCNLRGNYWEGGDKCFTTLSLWKIVLEGAEPKPKSKGKTQTVVDNVVDDDEEVPF